VAVMIPQDRYIDAGTIKVRYWALGEKGSPVILIHGLGASAEIWMHDVEALSIHHRVYVPDLVGFGKTGKPEREYTPALFITFLHEFIRALKIETPTLIGNSLGGGIALQYALLYPHNVDKLVLVDSAGLGIDAPLSLRIVSLPLVGELLARPSRIEAYVYFRGAVYDRSLLTKEFVDIYHKIHAQPGNQESLLKVIRALVSFRGGHAEMLNPVLTNLDRIRHPTLILWGRQDKVLPLSHAYVAQRTIPHSVLHIFDKCGHMPQFEKPEEFCRVVLEFLAQ